VINRLLTSTDLPPTEPIDVGEDALASLAKEPYCRLEDGRLVLVPANELDAAGVSRLFLSLFEGPLPVEHLSFMVDHHQDDYVNRLIDVLPDLQSGFFLDEDSIKTLRAIAPLFPSVWVTLASPIQIITTHRASQPDVENDAVLASDRTAFWEEVIKAVRSDFTNVFLRGFLYDHLGVAEMEEKVEVIVKSKQGSVGEMRTEGRNAVRQLSDELIGEAGTRHVLIRMLPTTKQPWDETHPGPAMPLESQS